MKGLKISHKGLILVSVPLLFELIFVGVLAKMLHDAEIRLQSEERARLVVSYLNELSRTIEDAAVALARSTAEDDTEFKDYNRIVSNRRQIFSNLKNLLQDHPDDLATVQDLEQTTDVALDLIGKARHTFGPGRNRLERLRYLPKLYRTAAKAKARIDRIVEKYKTIELSGPSAQEESRRIIHNLLVAAVAFNVVLTLALAAFFARGITTRLQIMTDNSLRLGREEPLNPLLGGSDEIADLDAVFHNMADALAEAKLKRQEVERLKQEFVAMVSHDLRAPLTAVRGTLSLLEEGKYGPLGETGLLRVRAAEHNVGRLIGLINDLLDIERMESGSLVLHTEQIPLGAVVEESIDSVSQLAEDKHINWEVSLKELEVKADFQRLVQVLVNLLSNAIKFSPAGQTITISAHRNENYAEVRVTDRGPGIPSKHQELIFERFKQVDSDDGSARKGSGLGLAIARAIVECHHGTIGVLSEEGAGSTFWFRIPLYSSPEPAPAQEDTEYLSSRPLENS